MEFFAVLAVIGGLVVLMILGLSKPGNRRTSRGPGPGAAGAVYDLLNEDKRKAIAIIVEGRAEKTDPETADDVPADEDDKEEDRRAK